MSAALHPPSSAHDQHDISGSPPLSPISPSNWNIASAPQTPTAAETHNLTQQTRSSPTDYASAFASSPPWSTKAAHKTSVLSVNQSLWPRPSPASRSRSLLRPDSAALSRFNPASSPLPFTSDLPSPTMSYRLADGAGQIEQVEVDTVPTSLLSPRLHHTSLNSPTSSPYSSPGPRIRRLAESFLNSLSDDSPSSRARSSRKSHESPLSSRSLVSSRAYIQSADQSHHNTASSDDSETSADDYRQLHLDIKNFALSCQNDQQTQAKLRDDLVNRTRWSIRSVWPTAEVDLVGSVAANVALPKSDLDFVIYFKPSMTVPPAHSYATSQQQQPSMIPPLPSILIDPATLLPMIAKGRNESASPSSTATTITPTSAASSQANTPSSTPQSSPLFPARSPAELPPTAAPLPTLSSSVSTSSPLILYQHFAHAGTLIKLIGGRKKSKVLFRSTKIQVFKDINLIRLRDGCSGISMDLWFPVECHITKRSQLHTDFIKKFSLSYSAFFPLSCTLKSFMQQNLLNSGYSGLGSYGVLLMIMRYLQHERITAAAEHRNEESNLGRLLIGFFRCFAIFDYMTQAISVSGEGGWIEKPELITSKRQRRKRVNSHGDGSDEEVDEREDVDDDEQSHPPADHDDDESTAANDGTTDEASTTKRRPSPLSDRFTMIIADPIDPSNQIVCHNKALRNMIQAFVRALTIIDPNTPPPVPLYMHDKVVNASTATTATNSAASSAGSSAISSTTVSPLHSKRALTSAPISSTSSFHRLIDVDAARSGPQMKVCPSPQCQSLPEGPTTCPIQNKICFVCNYMFVKPNSAHKKTQNNTSNNNARSRIQRAQGGQQAGAMTQLPQPQRHVRQFSGGAMSTPNKHYSPHPMHGTPQHMHPSMTPQRTDVWICDDDTDVSRIAVRANGVSAVLSAATADAPNPRSAVRLLTIQAANATAADRILCVVGGCSRCCELRRHCVRLQLPRAANATIKHASNAAALCSAKQTQRSDDCHIARYADVADAGTVQYERNTADDAAAVSELRPATTGNSAATTSQLPSTTRRLLLERQKTEYR